MQSLALPILLGLQTLGAIVSAFLDGVRHDAKHPGRRAREWAVFISLAAFLFVSGLALYGGVDWGGGNVQLPFSPQSLCISAGGLNLAFSLGIDSITLLLVLLTTLITLVATIASFGSIRERQGQYYAWLQALSATMIGTFIARDGFLLYIFFELTLIPAFFLIGGWGGADRRFAAGKFFLYTFAASIFTLAALLYLGGRTGSFDLDSLAYFAQTQLSNTERLWVTLGILAGFAVKVPLLPLHTWQPTAYTEAPAPATASIAGVLAKLGTYGILRLAIPIGFVAASGNGAVALPTLARVLGGLAVAGILYGALIAWVQNDFKRLLAYSSFSHLGFAALALFALNATGVQGSVLYMVNHGISTGALFLCIGMVEDRFHTLKSDAMSGLGRRMPVLAFFLVIFAMSSIGLPGTNGFVSEFLAVLSAFTSDTLGVVYGSIAAIGVLLGAVYMLKMLGNVLFGPLVVPTVEAPVLGRDPLPVMGHELATDLTMREVGLLTPLAVLVVVLGVLPGPLLDSISWSAKALLSPVQRATAMHGTPPSEVFAIRP